MPEPFQRPSLHDAARRGVKAKKGQAAPPAAQPAPASAPIVEAPTAAKAPAAPPQRPKPPVVGVEQVAVRCGHVVPFELFDLKKDKYRDARRKKLTDRDCSACRIKAQEEREAADREASRKRRQEKAKMAPPLSTPQHRLPHGSRFDVAYDAAKGEWSGTLTVPGLAPFTGSRSAVFMLLRTLDEMYRATRPAAEDAPDENRDVGGEG